MAVEPGVGGGAAHRFLSLLHPSTLTEWAELWADDGVMQFPYDRGDRQWEFVGRHAIVEYFRDAFEVFEPFHFSSIETVLTNGAAEVAEWHGEARLRDGAGTYRQHYIAIFRFDPEGRILLYREFRDPRAYVRAVASGNENEPVAEATGSGFREAAYGTHGGTCGPTPLTERP